MKDYKHQLLRHQQEYLGFRTEKEKVIVLAMFMIMLFLGIIN